MSSVPCTSPLGLSVIACTPLDNQEEDYTSTLDCQEEKREGQTGEKGFAPSVLGHLSRKELPWRAPKTLANGTPGSRTFALRKAMWRGPSNTPGCRPAPTL